jgi:hypothetical protein
MPRAQGSNASLLLLDEVTYGTKPGGNWKKLPFNSSDFGAEQKLVADDTIGHGREAIDPSQDVIDVQHSAVVPIDVRNIGYWLKGLLGAAVDTGAGPYDHTWKSGAAALPSRSIEIGITDVGQYFVKTGAVIGSMDFDFKPSGNAQSNITLIAQNDTRSNATSGGAPTSLAYQRFSQFTGSILLGGVALAGITEAKLKYDNKIDTTRTIRPDGLIEGVDPNMCDISGTLTARFEDATLFGDAESFDPVALQLGWTIDEATSLIFTLPRVFLPRPKSSVKGPGGIDLSFDFQTSHDPSVGYQLQAVLSNDVATY